MNMSTIEFYYRHYLIGCFLLSRNYDTAVFLASQTRYQPVNTLKRVETKKAPLTPRGLLRLPGLRGGTTALNAAWATAGSSACGGTEWLAGATNCGGDCGADMGCVTSKGWGIATPAGPSAAADAPIDKRVAELGSGPGFSTTRFASNEGKLGY